MKGLYRIGTHLLHRSLLSYVLYPFSLLYASILILRRRFYKNRAFKFSIPVISIGNIVCGGSGKTPLSIAIAKLLQERGLKVGISHRGYKGRYEKHATLISDENGIFPIAKQAGDEAFLLAKNLPGSPVVVGRKRKEAIELLIHKHPNLDLLILDDSFQHLQVYHALDIIAFDATIGFGNGFVLPAGYLREPLSAISQEHIVIINHKTDSVPVSALKNSIRKHTNLIFETRILIDSFYSYDGSKISVDIISSQRVISVSGIAFPHSFDNTLAQLGIVLQASFHYADHYDYHDPVEISKINQFVSDQQIDYILCTEKDFEKLGSHSNLRSRLLYLKISMVPDNANELISHILKGVDK